MPDNEDYRALGELLRDPLSWSDPDAAIAEMLLRDQALALTAVHPRNAERRTAMEAVVQQLEKAIERWRSRP